MASYIQGLTDIPVPVEPFQPDFGMVQKVLGTLQSRYEQGFASVKNAYNQVLNAPLTNTALRTQRDAYVKEAEQKLKNLSSVDLSLPENQMAAEQVFSPFWEDGRILMDASRTKLYKSEITRGENARDSTDEKVREQYNDLSMRYLYNGLEELRDTDPNSPEFAKLQPRRWVPFHNLEKYLDEQAKAEDLKIEWKSAMGPYLVNVKNGQRARDPFRNWAHNKLGNNFQPQFNVLGTLESEEGLKDLMARDPTLTKQKALEVQAANVMAQLKQGYEDRTTEIGESLRQIETKMKPLLNKDLSADTDQEEIQELRMLDRQRRTLEEQQTALQKEYDAFTTKAPQTYADIVRNPVNYFANANKQRVVNGWATGRAGIESMDVDINPAIKESNETAYNMAKLRYEYDKLAQDKWIAESKMIDSDGDGVKDMYVGDGDGSGSGSGGGSGGGGRGGGKARKGDGSGQDITSGRNVGAGITDITKTGSAIDIYRQEQANRLQAANENFLSLDGVARVLTTKLGFGNEDARNFVSEVRRAIGDPEHTSLTSDARFQPILTALEKETGKKVNDGISTRDALLAVGGQYIAEKLKGGGKNTSPEDRMMVRKYMFGLQALQVYNSSETRRLEAVNKALSSEKKFEPLKKTNSNGTVDMVGVGDLAKYFTEPSYTFQEKNSRKRFNLTPYQLAQLYAEGKIGNELARDGSGDLTIDGTRVEQVETVMDPKTFEVSNNVYTGLVALSNRFRYTGSGSGTDVYGSKGFKSLSEQLNQLITPDLPEFENKTGKFGVRYKYDLRSDVDNEFSYRLLSELQNADNRVGIYYDGKPSDSTELDDAVLKLLNQGETTMEKFVSAIHITSTGPNGNPIVEFSVIPVKETDKTDVTGDVELTKLAQKKTIAIEMSPNASGTITRSIRFNSGFYVFGDLLKGKVYKSDAIMEAAGFSFSVMPDDDRNPSFVTIAMDRTVFDDKTGKNKPLNHWESKPIYFAERTPDEIMGLIYQYLDAHLKGNEEANSRYDQGAKTNARKGREWLGNN